MYKVITVHGYYYAEGGTGNYGRFNGQRWQGWFLCRKHAEEIALLVKHQRLGGGEAELVEVNGGTCQQCKRERKD